ncbi:MAG: FtsL-like putative cell division protein [Bacteroides sp.]|nr:FtsL-like putative cell division protein [Bacteroides sp.]
MAEKKETTQESGRKNSATIRSILTGDILVNDFLRRQSKLLIIVLLFIVFHIHSRYTAQQQLIEIDRLKKELIDIKYDALTRSSELMEKSRQSRIEEYVSQEESQLQTSTHPPFLIE